MESKSVLIVEDSVAQRESLRLALEMRGFQVFSAGDPATARQIIKASGKVIDVAILDMRLESSNEPDTTGAHIGMELLATQPVDSTEFIIHSAYAEVDYSRLALHLGAAAYFSKARSNLGDLIRHTRVLALRRALNVESPQNVLAISRIAESSRDKVEVVVKFCNEVLSPELTECIGASYILLISNKRGIHGFISNLDWPSKSHAYYQTLQALTHCNGYGEEPYLVVSSLLPFSTDSEDIALADKLDGAAFIPLFVMGDLRLSLGLIRQAPMESPLAENVQELAKTLTKYFRPAIMEYLLSALATWTEHHTRRRAILSATSQLCLYIGQKQLAMLADAEQSQECTLDGPHLNGLKDFADDLSATGQTLLPTRDLESNVNAAELMQEVIAALRTEDKFSGIIYQLEGNCQIQAPRDELIIGIFRLCQWLSLRKVETPPDTTPQISVTCEQGNRESHIIIADRSRRLPREIRRQLFSPFTQALPPLPATKDNWPGMYLPLFMTKMLVEEKFNGILEDVSDELEGNIGHKFHFRFPHSGDITTVHVAAGL